MAADFNQRFQREISLFESHLKDFFAAIPREDIAGIRRLIESMEYSLIGSGGKRFRPVLAVLTAGALKIDPHTVMDFAVAVEMIHTYSLIHDDLPSMDNDDLRRGKPTNHKVYGEAMALLAGDALLTEAFTHLADAYAEESALAGELISLLGRATGLRGMVGGQAIDILPAAGQKEEWEVRYAHNLKTGALIRVAIEGAAVIGGSDEKVRQALRQYGKSLGLAFQLADDILDSKPGNEEPNSFVTVLGKESTERLLADVTNQAIEALRSIGLESTALAEIAGINQSRARA